MKDALYCESEYDRGAGCGKTARPDLYGGLYVNEVPNHNCLLERSTVHVGKCLCERIKYEYDGEMNEISMCHCVQCQKAQGSAFAAVTPIESEKFKIVEGAEYMKEFRSSENKVRAFCRECGSPIYSARDDLPNVKRLRIGTLDAPVKTKNKYHIFVGSKSNWFEFEDRNPKYERFKE